MGGLSGKRPESVTLVGRVNAVRQLVCCEAFRFIQVWPSRTVRTLSVKPQHAMARMCVMVGPSSAG